MQKQFPLSVFVFIDSFVVSALQDAGGYAISRQNNLELRLGCHTCWLSYFTLVCLWCGRTVSRSVYGHVIAKFSRMGRLLHFLTHGALLRELRYNQLSFLGEFKKFVPYCWRFRTEAGSSTFFAFVILLLKPIRSFFFFLIYFNYLIFVFFNSTSLLQYIIITILFIETGQTVLSA